MRNFIAGLLTPIVLFVVFALFCISYSPFRYTGQINGIMVSCEEMTVSIFNYDLDTRFTCNSTPSNTETPDDAR